MEIIQTFHSIVVDNQQYVPSSQETDRWWGRVQLYTPLTWFYNHIHWTLNWSNSDHCHNMWSLLIYHLSWVRILFECSSNSGIGECSGQHDLHPHHVGNTSTTSRDRSDWNFEPDLTKLVHSFFLCNTQLTLLRDIVSTTNLFTCNEWLQSLYCLSKTEKWFRRDVKNRVPY